MTGDILCALVGTLIAFMVLDYFFFDDWPDASA